MYEDRNKDDISIERKKKKREKKILKTNRTISRKRENNLRSYEIRKRTNSVIGNCLLNFLIKLRRKWKNFSFFFFLNILWFVFQSGERERERLRLKNKWKRNIRNFSFLFQIKFRPDLEREGNVNKHLVHL